VLRGFRDFLFRGNVIDLAVAVVIGVAFNNLVNAFTTAFLRPLIGLVLGGGVHGGTLTLNGQTFDFGGFINALITFVVITTVVYFLVVLPMHTLMDLRRRGEPVEAPPPSEEVQLLAEIRDLLRQQASPPRP